MSLSYDHGGHLLHLRLWQTLRKWLQDEQRKVMWKEVVAKRRRLKEAMRLSDLSGLGVAFTSLDKVKEAQVNKAAFNLPPIASSTLAVHICAGT